jgi:pimeloyl-ACP methyl ester carboxylesterase
VLAPDLPGVHLAALAARAPRPSLAGAIAPLLDALAAPAGELAFLAGRIAPRFGLVGHSLGALVVEALAAAREDVVVAIALAEQGVRATGRPLTTLVMGGTRDGFEPWRKQQRGFEGSGAPKRLVGVKDAGHMAFADHCAVAADAGGWYGAARARGVSLPGFLGALAERGCRDGALAIARAHAVILAAVTATLEETLACDPSAAATFVGLRTHPDVAEVREALAR